MSENQAEIRKKKYALLYKTNKQKRIGKMLPLFNGACDMMLSC